MALTPALFHIVNDPMTNQPTQVIFDPWDTYVVTTDEGPIFISFDEGATQEDLSESLPYCARVIIGPTSVSSAMGSPTFILAAFATSSDSNSSATGSWTSSREQDTHS